METAKIRPGLAKDLPQVMELIKELAAFERASHEVKTTVEQLERDGFGPQPLFGFLVAELDRIVGISFYYYRYSTWKGKRLYLEDIVVSEKLRGKGIGKQLFEATLAVALSEQCSGITWQVLEWNTPAITFYSKYKARLDAEWTNGSLEREDIERLLTK